jgi:hypothetical protein
VQAEDGYIKQLIGSQKIAQYQRELLEQAETEITR